jgi:hypothetical protein
MLNVEGGRWDVICPLSFVLCPSFFVRRQNNGNACAQALQAEVGCGMWDEEPLMTDHGPRHTGSGKMRRAVLAG